MDMKAQRFGIEVELTGITPKEAADIAAAYFGTSSRYLGAGYDTYAALEIHERCQHYTTEKKRQADHIRFG